jgi:4-amino-4-deoxy-L-arabinose transferase-like glycosyltransferase
MDPTDKSEEAMTKKKKIKGKSSSGLIKKLTGFGQFNLTAVSLLIAVVGQYFLYSMKWELPGLITYAVAAALFILADYAGAKKEEQETITPLMEISIFILIMAIAVFFRVWQIDHLPAGCFRDEGQNGNEGINIMNGITVDGTRFPVYIERYTQNAAMYMYFVAAAFKMLGIGVLQVRAVSIVIGILCVPAFYFLVRHLFGVRLAIVGGFLMAVTRWHVNFSRIGFLGILTVFFVILCMYFAYRVYRKRGIFDFIMLGACTALSLYTYLAGRLIPAGLVIFLVYLFITETSFYVKSLKGIIACFIAFFVVAGPIGIYAMQHPENFMSRTSTVSIFNKEMLHAIGGRYVEKDGNPKHWTKLYMENIHATLLMFNYIGDGNPRHNFQQQPMLDFLTGIFFMMGILYALYHIRKPRYFLLLAFFVAFLQAGLLSTESPQAYRTIVEIPVALLFALIAAEKTVSRAYSQYGSGIMPAVNTAGIVLLLVIGFNNYQLYFDRWAKNPGSWAEFSTDEYTMGRYINKLGPEWTALVNPAWADSYTFRFAVYPYDNYALFDPATCVPIRDKSRQNFVYVLDESYLPLLSVLQKMYPHGKYSDFRHKYNNNILLYFAYEVPYEDAKQYQDRPNENGLTGAYYRGTEWAGSPVFKRIDPFILFNWTRDPVAWPFSVKWTGRIKISKSGEYNFMTTSNDYSDLYIDGKKVLVNPGFAAGEKAKESSNRGVNLSAGYHDITLRYYESLHYSKMQLWWKPPYQNNMEVIPSEVLFP